jgi:hypothetical protein
MSALADRLAAVRARVETACRRVGREPDAAAIVAVSKRHSVAAIAEALAAGHRDFGENYAQELGEKATALAGATLRWHFIGQLQRNKARAVVGVAALIHAVDSERLLRRIDQVTGEINQVQPILLAVNLGGEEQKSGIDPAGLPALVALAASLPALRCDGLMTMPPLPADPEDSRPHYRRLRELRDQLATPSQPLPELSMGTTGDLEVAAEEGATLIRVGTAIFGPRT